MGNRRLSIVADQWGMPWCPHDRPCNLWL